MTSSGTAQPEVGGPADLGVALAAFAAAAGTPHQDAGPGPVLVASDFDGVLAPLGDDPLASRPTPAAAAALARLAACGPDRVRVALVSGRRIEDLAHLASPPPGALLVGSHGAETGEVLAPLRDGADDERSVRADGTAARVRLVPVALDEAQRDLLDEVAAGLEEIAAPLEGAWVEHKPSAAVLHTRLSPAGPAHTASTAAAELGERLGAHVMVGKNVVEIAVTRTSKGIALDALRERLGSPAVLYLGDDVTDERAFAVLGPADVGIKVGDGETLAAYRVADPAEAAAALTTLADLLDV
ncbi:trehalose-phosphatase [Oerskovia sp. NPDC056781]|uniref:trehalose-phosphatase n=1 Tax=Oerskovia sp. NPDC056781 TaxID=3345942 RepID=UPI0036709DC4